MKNKTFTIGNDFTVDRLGYGAMRITGKGVWGEPANRTEAIRVLRRAVESGINFIDTADSYGPHVSEEIIAEALYPYPAGLVIATKGGFDRPGPDQWVENGKPEHLKSACEGSLRRLRLDRIDLYQLHRIDPKVPAEEQLRGSQRFTGARKNQTPRIIRSERPADSTCANHRAHRQCAESLQLNGSRSGAGSRILRTEEHWLHSLVPTSNT